MCAEIETVNSFNFSLKMLNPDADERQMCWKDLSQVTFSRINKRVSQAE